MNNEITPELGIEIKDKNKRDALQYDADLRNMRNDIIEYYMARVQHKAEDESMLELMCETMEEFEIDATDLASILKNDETMLNAIKVDCISRNLLKEKNKHVEIGEIFE